MALAVAWNPAVTRNRNTLANDVVFQRWTGPNFTLKSMRLLGHKVGSPAAGVVASIRATSGGFPTGGDLATVTFPPADFGTTTFPTVWTPLRDLSTELEISGGIMMCIYCTFVGTVSGNLISLWGKPGYTGAYYWATAPGETWYLQEFQIDFELWGDIAGGPKDCLAARLMQLGAI